ncbi:hypothetical protein [Magnetospirillum moscoviense]|uniref:Uncharacterized protein n=1 Tax=Magnetospirillum moscoviense TaxID=1437059 RepID=A0A178MXQ7_9PROT|nr:hypothetical protein [Magnetospirillum moscoviense]OAN56863.1 hypothetical protein A6A05_07790 [Magnetospirillum moscoviense]
MTTRAEAHQRLRADVDDLAALISDKLERVVPRVLAKYGVEWHEVEPGWFDEVAANTAKDLEKLAVYQNEAVDPHKQIGYAAFWIRKLKPIKIAHTNDKKPFACVNEHLSLWLACEQLVSHMDAVVADRGDQALKLRDEVVSRIHRFLKDAKGISYIVHCMRSRTFGPHHYVILLRQFTVL